MDVNYADGSLLALWYDTWLALLAYTVALLVGILTVASTRWHGPGLLLNVVMVLAVLAGLPITMLRVGINLAVSDYEALGYLNLVGTVVALAVGVTYLRRQGFGFRQMLAGPMAESITPTQGLTLQTEVGQSGGPAATMMADATPTPKSPTQGSRCSHRRRRPGFTSNLAPWRGRPCPSNPV